MIYTTQQLTTALQELTARSQEFGRAAETVLPEIIPVDQLRFSQEIEVYLEHRQNYSQQTRNVSVGSY